MGRGLPAMKPLNPFNVLLGVLGLVSLAGGAESLSDRIGRVENSLESTTAVAGRCAGRFTLTERMRFYQTPGVSIAVIENGEIAWARGYGRLETGKDELVAEHTRFQAASISKPVAALVALRLVEKGKLQLDEAVNLRLVSWKVPGNRFTDEKPVTLRGILSHRAGLTDNAGFLAAARSRPAPTLRDILEQGKWTPAPIRVGYEPGSRFQYSGGGYCLMEQLLEDVTGEPFPELARRLVLEPCGMLHSSFEQDPKHSAIAVGHLANGKPLPQRSNIYPATSAAGLWTTPADLARFVIELQRAWAGQPSKLISQAMASELLRPQGDTLEQDSKRIAQMEAYPTTWRLSRGLGVGLIGLPPVGFYHTGSNPGYQSELHGYIDRGKGAIVMTNADQGWRLAREMINAIAKEYDWPEFDYPPEQKTAITLRPEQRESLLGEYTASYDGRQRIVVRILEKDGQLFLDISDYPHLVELIAESESQWFTLENAMKLSFRKDESGVAVEVISDQGWRAKRRLPNASP